MIILFEIIYGANNHILLNCRKCLWGMVKCGVESKSMWFLKVEWINSSQGCWFKIKIEDEIVLLVFLNSPQFEALEFPNYF